MPTIFRARRRFGDTDIPHASSLTLEQRAFETALNECYDAHVEAMRVGDVDSLVQFFTPDAVWMGAGWSTCIGHRDLRERFALVSGRHTVTFTSLHTFVDGNAGWDYVDYAVCPNDEAVPPWIFRTAFQFAREQSRWLCKGVLCYTVATEE